MFLHTASRTMLHYSDLHPFLPRHFQSTTRPTNMQAATLEEGDTGVQRMWRYKDKKVLLFCGGIRVENDERVDAHGSY